MSRLYGRVGCLAPGCVAKHRAKGYCAKHWHRLHVHGDLELHRRKGHGVSWSPICSVSGCGNPRMGSYRMCGFHRYRAVKYKDPLAEGIFKETVGGSAEQTVIQLLEGYGRKVVVAPYNSPFDFTVDGLRVEVKCALPRKLTVKRNGATYFYSGWQLNIHRHNVLDESSVDLYVFCLSQPGTMPSQVFLLKRAPLGAKTVQFTLKALRKLKYQKALADFYAFAHGRFAERAA